MKWTNIYLEAVNDTAQDIKNLREGEYMEISTILFALIRAEIFGESISNDLARAITKESMHSLYRIAKHHDLAHLVANSLKKNGFLRKGEDITKCFMQERNMAIYRYEQMRYELENIQKILTEESIPFVLLKGGILRKLYPEEWMRTSCDIDILVKEEQLDIAAEALQKHLGYTCAQQRAVNELSLYSKTGVHLEMHYDLSEGNRYGKEILSNVWQYVTKADDEEGTLLELTDSVFYFYHIAHMVKHFEYGGCGIRSFLDLWLMKQKVQFNQEELSSLLEVGGFLQFATVCERLAEVWFGDAENDELGMVLQEYIIEGGLYGTLHAAMGMQHAKKGGKFKYFLSRVFISNSELRIKYPQLQKRPWLTPFYHIKRWIRPITKKESSEYSRKLLEESSHISKEEKRRSEWLLQELGLKP